MEKIIEKLNLDYPKFHKFSLLHYIGLGLFIAAIFAGAYFFLAHGKMQEEIQTHEKRKAEATTTLEQYQLSVAQEGVVKDKLAAKIGVLSEKKQQMPSEKDLPRLLNRVADLGKVMGLEILNYKVGEPSKKEFYKQIPLIMTLNGPYSNTAGFLDSLQNLLQIIKINSLAMRQRPSQVIGRDEDNLPTFESVMKLETAISVTTFAYID